MYKPAPKTEREARVHAILKLRLGGAESPDICEWAAAPEQNWNVSERQLWRYIQQADALCEKYFESKATHLLGRHLLQRRQLYAHALGAGDFGTALRVLQDEAKLESIYDLDLDKRIQALEEVVKSQYPTRPTRKDRYDSTSASGQVGIETPQAPSEGANDAARSPG